MTVSDYIRTIGAVLAIVAMLFGAYFYVDSRYAQCAELRALERRLEYKIQNDQLMGMQQRLWQLEERYPKGDQAPPPVQTQMKELNHAIEMQKEKVKRIEGR
jgi:hypothetical protein